MQRARGKRKRLQDPARHGYRDLLDRAGIDGHLLDASNRNSTEKLGGAKEERHASDDEGAAVLAAVGVKLDRVAKGSPLARVESAATDATSPESEDGVRLMKSPDMQNLESPELSGESAFGDDDTEGPSSPEPHLKSPSFIIRRPTGEMESDGVEFVHGEKVGGSDVVSSVGSSKTDTETISASNSSAMSDENVKLS